MGVSANAPATEPQITQLFSQALDLLQELEDAASANGRGWEPSPEFLSDEESQDFSTRLIQTTTGNDPLELQVLDRALFMISELLIHDRFLRDEFSAYREFCTEARARKLNQQQEAAR